MFEAINFRLFAHHCSCLQLKLEGDCWNFVYIAYLDTGLRRARRPHSRNREGKGRRSREEEKEMKSLLCALVSYIFYFEDS